MSKFWQKIWQNVIITDIWLWARCWGISGPGVAPLPGLWHPWSKRFLDQGCPSSITLFCLIFSPQPSTTDPVSAEQCIKMREKEKQERQNSISSGWNTFTTQELTTGSKQKKHTGLFLNIRTLLWPWANTKVQCFAHMLWWANKWPTSMINNFKRYSKYTDGTKLNWLH